MEHGTRYADPRDPVPAARPGLRILPPYEEQIGGTGPDVLRVLVVGSAPLIRGGLRAALDQHDDLVTAGECEPAGVAGAVAARSPDVLLLNLGGEDARACADAAAAAHAAAPGLRVVALECAGVPVPPGVDCTLPPFVTPAHLASAIRMVAAGYQVRWPDTPAAARPEAARPAADGLSRRERDVLALIARGLSNAEIARTLTLSEHTVKTHVQNLLGKLDVPNRLHAVIHAYESGLCGRDS
ncbi:response regulator transcription factor [Couchioplanes azureus]|uniref:response regulator transcription factor n=1 Tax=Couchioplanes caeruleus TaxID=56438 RepID=UPI0019B071A0|nr:response regulator transcription factor [Couchioplanes caeruleus]GGQ87562.1 DNA-binding response regulator [Couchioplanes caeruleus subsp. azureus]